MVVGRAHFAGQGPTLTTIEEKNHGSTIMARDGRLPGKTGQGTKAVPLTIISRKKTITTATTNIPNQKDTPTKHMNSTTIPISTISISRPLEITGTINTTRTNVTMGNTKSILNPMRTIGSPKDMKTGTTSHILTIDTTRIPTDTRVFDTKNSHRYKTSDHPRTNSSRTRQPTSVQTEIKSHKEINICGLNVCVWT